MKLAPPRDGEQPYVEALEFDVQARVKGGAEYEPLVDVHGVPSWPAEPDYTQLVNGRVLAEQAPAFEAVYEDRRAGHKTIRVTTDFDLVVLGVPVATLPHVARELIDREPRWRAMVEHVKTVPTQAFQVWMETDMHELGWERPPVNLSGFVHPFDTWADMTHLVPEEALVGARALDRVLLQRAPGHRAGRWSLPPLPRRRAAACTRQRRSLPRRGRAGALAEGGRPVRAASAGTSSRPTQGVEGRPPVRHAALDRQRQSR